MMGSGRLRDGADCDTVVVTRVKVGDADATLVSQQRICARSFGW